MNKPKRKVVKRTYGKDNLTGSMFWEYEKGCEADYNYNLAHEDWMDYLVFLLKNISSKENMPMNSYYQGKFDILMDLLLIKKEE